MPGQLFTAAFEGSDTLSLTIDELILHISGLQTEAAAIERDLSTFKDAYNGRIDRAKVVIS